MNIFTKSLSQNQDPDRGGYVLPATILLGIATAIISVIFFQFTVQASDIMNGTFYEALAKDASIAGTKYADSCVQGGVITWSSLAPNKQCTGTTSTGSAYVAQRTGEWRSTFSVSTPDSDATVVSTGTVELLTGSTVVKTYTATTKMSIGGGFKYHPVASGEVLTDIKSQSSSCAIANGKLYCWGKNVSATVGDNSTTARADPKLVQGALAGKTVTHVVVADRTTCAIGDGVPYCWGANDAGQLGNGSTRILDGYLGGSGTKLPTANIPNITTSDLSGGYVTDISVSPQNQPSAIWPLAVAQPHACALKADGTVSCWGSNAFRQAGWMYCVGLIAQDGKCCAGLLVLGYCIGFSIYSYPDKYTPTYVNGYSGEAGGAISGSFQNDNLAPWKGKKAVRVASSAHDDCLIADGRMYCMGVEVPLEITCNTGLFIPATVGISFNVCTTKYSGGYDMSAKDGLFFNLTQWFQSGFKQDLFTGYTLDDKIIDPKAWALSTNIACGMANTNFFCVGQGPVWSELWGASWTPPWNESDNSNLGLSPDITSNDNGDNEYGISLMGVYCIVDKGVAKCRDSTLSNVRGSDHSTGPQWQPVDGRNGLGGPGYPDISVQIPTKIAAGTSMGCLVANGRLYCWGIGDDGRLANGSTAYFQTYKYPTLVGLNTGGTGTAIGNSNENDNWAANGNVSAGGNHSCSIFNGQLACWGDNTYGQLGTGSNTDEQTPLTVEDFQGEYTNAVSAGTNHTCAIKFGKLYCWGDNSYGQLGLGTTGGSYNTPQLVGGSLSGKRVTEISAGVSDTCAIANGQAYCWGNGANGKLGQGNTSNYASPQIVNGKGSLATKAAVTKISAGTNHTCVVANADAYCWGLNNHGQLGVGNTTNYTTPQLLTQGMAGTPKSSTNLRPSVSDISAGGDFSCGIFNGKTGCWGLNNKGQLGVGSESWIEYGTPYKVSCTPDIFGNGCDGRDCTGGTFLGVCLGWTYYNWYTPQTNHSGLLDKNVPTAIKGNAGTYYATEVSAGGSHACALIDGDSSATNGNMWCWGAGADGRVGNGSTSDSYEPVRITGGDTVKDSVRRVATSISAGPTSTCSVSNGVVLCWGTGTDGKLGNGDTLGKTTPKQTASIREIVPYAAGVIF